MSRRKKSVCVIGAGVSGLVTVKELLAEGHDVDCFESAEGLGGAFAGKDVSANRAYESLYLTISNYYMAFSDFPPMDGWKFWTGGEYLQYLKDYAAAFNLMPHIAFSTPVTAVKRVGEARWHVSVRRTSDGAESSKVYDAIAVCCGTHQVPKTPAIEGLETFTGTIRHSYSFWDAKEYVGKRVVVVGLGESSADIVRDVSDVTAECHLVVRQYPFCLPRVLPDGFPADSMTSRVLYASRDDSLWTWLLFFLFFGLFYLPAHLLGYVAEWPYVKDAFGQEVAAFMDVNTRRTPEVVELMAKWHGTSNVSFMNKYATKNCSWVPNVIDGKIQPHLGRIRCVSDNRVLLDDGSTVEADAILFCTGYRDDFAFMPPDAVPANNDVRKLFLHAFKPDVGPSLAYVGFSRPTTGAIPACSELVARYFALLVSGERTLPADAADRALRDEQYEDALIYNSIEVRSCVNPCEYMDAVARLIGCYRSHYYYALRPYRYMRWLSALNCAARFRLTGPHACPEQAEAWLDRIPITLPFPAVISLCVYKLASAVGLASGDLMLDLRKRKVEATWVLAFG